MALEIKYTVNVITNSVASTFTDLTGDYPNPLTGWSGANVSKSAVGAATLTIFFPDSSTLLPDDTSTNFNIVDLFARGYPTTSVITLLPADYLQTTTIPDGVYLYRLIIYSTTDPQTVLYTIDWYGFTYKKTQCCIDSKLERLCNCEDGLPIKQKRILRARLDFYSLDRNQASCQDAEDAAITLQHAMDICTNDCQTCSVCHC